MIRFLYLFALLTYGVYAQTPTRAPVEAPTPRAPNPSIEYVYLNKYYWSTRMKDPAFRVPFLDEVFKDIHSSGFHEIELDVQERVVFPLDAYNQITTKQDIIDQFLLLRGLDTLANAPVAAFETSGGGRRLQTSGTIILELNYRMSEDEFYNVVGNFNDTLDAHLSTQLASALSLPANSITLSYELHETTVGVSVFAQQNNGLPVKQANINDIVNQKPIIDNIVNAAFTSYTGGGINSIDLSRSLDLCYERTTRFPECASCNSNTGVCTCNQGWLGVSCNVEAICQNGGTLIAPDNYCKCIFPYFGDLCEQTRDCTCN